IVNKLVALALGHAFRGGGRFAGGCSRLVPALATVIRSLNDLAKPAARLRSVQPIRISGRSLEMIDFPARKVGTADVPPFALCVRCEDERALAGANQYSYSAHNLLLPASSFRINFFSSPQRYSRGRPATSLTGRTSIVPMRAPGTRAAMPIASSRSLAWIRNEPAICSRVSPNGPSVTKLFPSRTRTIAAVDAGCSGEALRYFPSAWS